MLISFRVPRAARVINNYQSPINNESIIKDRTINNRERDLSDDELVELMVKHPDLIQRPIIEKGARAILARPAEHLKEIL